LAGSCCFRQVQVFKDCNPWFTTPNTPSRRWRWAWPTCKSPHNTAAS